MLRFFKPVTTDDAVKQQALALQQSAAAAALTHAERERHALNRPKPGRPRVIRLVDDALTTPSADPSPQPHPKRSKYANWFASPHIHDILRAYQQHDHSARRTVAYLQRAFPLLPTEDAPRFAELTESTVRSWHDKEGKLLPQFSAMMEEQRMVAVRGTGPLRALDPHPAVAAEVKRVLTIMRERGAVVNIMVIRLVMRAIIEKTEPSLLQQLTLSSGFISTWSRREMGWSWRVRTTAASKLPADWSTQGVTMAKRIAYFMQAYKVRRSLHACQAAPLSYMRALLTHPFACACVPRSPLPSSSTWIRPVCTLPLSTTARTRHRASSRCQ